MPVAGEFRNFIFEWAGGRFVRVAADDQEEAGEIARESGFGLLVEKGACRMLGMDWNTKEKGVVSSSRDS